jgi:hypothetical protein
MRSSLQKMAEDSGLLEKLAMPGFPALSPLGMTPLPSARLPAFSVSSQRQLPALNAATRSMHSVNPPKMDTPLGGLQQDVAGTRPFNTQSAELKASLQRTTLGGNPNG